MREYKAHKIKRQIYELNVQLRAHQDKCKHLRATYVNRANTGNYDPSADSYWTDWSCPTCLKKWNTAQNEDRYGNARKPKLTGNCPACISGIPKRKGLV